MPLTVFGIEASHTGVHVGTDEELSEELACDLGTGRDVKRLALAGSGNVCVVEGTREQIRGLAQRMLTATEDAAAWRVVGMSAREVMAALTSLPGSAVVAVGDVLVRWDLPDGRVVSIGVDLGYPGEEAPDPFQSVSWSAKRLRMDVYQDAEHHQETDAMEVFTFPATSTALLRHALRLLPEDEA